MNFIVHPTNNAAAACWAATCRAGDVAGLLGPGAGQSPSAASASAGDETALPAIARILKTASPQTSCQAILEVDGAEDEQVLARPVEWLHRGGAAPGAVKLLTRHLPVFSRPRTFMFGRMRFDTFRDIRRHLRSIWKMPRDQRMVTVYRRRGTGGEIREEPRHCSAA